MESVDHSLENVVEPVCRAHGVELVQVRKLTQPGRTVLRVIIDRDRVAPGGDEPSDGSGVTLADCTAVSRDLSTALDVHEDLLPGPYALEVSSPGLERPLVRLADYERFRGREAKVQLSAPVDGRRRFTGTLLGVDGERVRIDQDGTEVTVPFADIHKAHLVYRFSR